MTGDMGKVYPINLTEVLPGDTIQQHSNVLVRMSPMAAPVFHPVTVRVHHFFVPNRLLWDGWEDFITGGPDGMNAESPPSLAISGTPGQLHDYFGMPNSVGLQANALPFRAYNLIWNEWYRDQDLVPEVEQDSQAVNRCAWQKDYFTSCRPWTQKGPEVSIPVGDRAKVKGIGITGSPGGSQSGVKESDGSTRSYTNSTAITRDNPAGYTYIEGVDGFPNIYADLANATGASINDVRKAFALQRYQEARARYGSRYTEYLRYLGVNPRDSRLQRPELLGGGQSQVNFSEVLQTAPETGTPPTTEYGVGDMYGHGIAALRSNKYRRFIEEHGYILSLLSVRPKAMYTQGIHRTFLRKDKEDYWQKELQFIGQQEVFNNELFASSETGEQVFGYQDRYMEYREQPSTIAGDFKNTLNYWHLAREFSQQPALNASFVSCVPSKRIFNEQTRDSMWIMVQNRIVARRLLSRSAAPKIL